MHRGVNHWDYFVKTVQIDGTVFDLTANVRKKADGEFVYIIEMMENNEVEPSSPQDSQNGGRNGVPNSSTTSIRNSEPEVKGYSLSDINSMPRGRGTLGRDIMYAPAAGESPAVPNADNAVPNAENVLANAENALPDAAAAKNASAESPYEGIPIRADSLIQ